MQSASRRERAPDRARASHQQALPGRALGNRVTDAARVGALPCLISMVTEDIAENFSEPLKLKDIGDASGYSVYQIIRTFRRRLGTTPHAYIMNMRISYAAERLAQGDTIAGAAAEAGFADQSHMTRHFKRVLGATPLQYVQSQRDIGSPLAEPAALPG